MKRWAEVCDFVVYRLEMVMRGLNLFWGVFFLSLSSIYIIFFFVTGMYKREVLKVLVFFLFFCSVDLFSVLPAFQFSFVAYILHFMGVHTFYYYYCYYE